MNANGASQQPPLDDGDIERWLRLFERLDFTLASAGGPDAFRTFRALGPRRWAHAHRRLVHERQRLVLEAASIGVCPVEGRVIQHLHADGDGTLDTVYAALADAYAMCAPIAQRLGNLGLSKWLLDRARVHRQHSLFLMAG